MTHTHSPRCIENARQAIAENNAATEATNEVTGETTELTAETEAEALRWLAEGTIDCYSDGDYCN